MPQKGSQLGHYSEAKQPNYYYHEVQTTEIDLNIQWALFGVSPLVCMGFDKIKMRIIRKCAWRERNVDTAPAKTCGSLNPKLEQSLPGD